MRTLLPITTLLLWASAAALPLQAAPVSQAEGPFVRMVRHNDGSRTVTAKSPEKDQQEIVTYDAEGNLRLKRVYQLDRYGKPESFVIYNGSETPILRGEFSYDVSDRMEEERLYELPSGEMVRRLIQRYDPSGRKLDPQQQNYKPLPRDLLHWMNPDGSLPEIEGGKRGASGQGGGERGEKKGFFKRMLGRDRKK